MERKPGSLVVLRPPETQEPPRPSLSFHPPKAVKGDPLVIPQKFPTFNHPFGVDGKKVGLEILLGRLGRA
jgi:hypothetical protein